MNWVLIKKLADLTACTEDAVRAKIKRGVWLQGVHWRKAPDGWIHFTLHAIQAWIGGRPSIPRQPRSEVAGADFRRGDGVQCMQIEAQTARRVTRLVK